MERFNWKSTISLNISLFKLFGLWPEGEGGYKINLYLIRAIVTVLFFGFAQSFCQTWLLVTNLSDMKIVAGTAFLAISEMLVVLKMFYMGRNIKIIKKLMVILDSDIFQPRNVEQIAMVTPTLKLFKMLSKCFCGSATMTVFFWALFPIMEHISKRNYKLPFLAKYPYNTSVSPFYEISYCHQIASILFIAYGNVGMDTLIAALFVYTGAQIDILCDNLKNIQPQGFSRSLVECVNHHRTIISFLQSFNKGFDWIIFVQFFASATSLGLTMFILTVIQFGSSDFFSFVCYGTAALQEILIYCWFGNEVTYKSKNIAVVAFESNWLEASPQAKRELIFFMLKTQRVLTVSALNLFHLSTENFLKILKSAYSYFALASRLNSEK